MIHMRYKPTGGRITSDDDFVLTHLYSGLGVYVAKGSLVNLLGNDIQFENGLDLDDEPKCYISWTNEQGQRQQIRVSDHVEVKPAKEPTAEEKYNGWANWSTWNAYNWLTSTKSAYDAVRNAIKDVSGFHGVKWIRENAFLIVDMHDMTEDDRSKVDFVELYKAFAEDEVMR